MSLSFKIKPNDTHRKPEEVIAHNCEFLFLGKVF